MALLGFSLVASLAILAPQAGHAVGVATCATPGSPPLRGVTAIAVGSDDVSCSYVSTCPAAAAPCDVGYVAAGLNWKITTGTANGPIKAQGPTPHASFTVSPGTEIWVTILQTAGSYAGVVGVGDQEY